MKFSKLAVMEKSVAEVFGLSGEAAQKTKIWVGDGSHPAVPKKIEGYVFQRELVREIMAFLLNPSLGCGFGVHGHAGCGKSTMFEQFFAAVGLPLYTVVATKTMTKDDIVGAYHPAEGGGLVFKERSLIRAMKEGIPIFFDEYNNFAPEVCTSLNEVLERRPLLVEQTGELVAPQFGFNVFAGFNHEVGLGLYSARSAPDLSNADRFIWRQATYPEPEVEQEIVARALAPFNVDAKAAKQIATSMVKVADAIRKQFVGDEANQTATIETVLTTRTLVKWARLTGMNSHLPNGRGLAVAFDLAFLNRPMPESNREAIQGIAHAEFGEELYPLPTKP